LNNDGERYKQRLYLSQCAWYHAVKTVEDNVFIRSDFVIISLLVSRCTRKYISATVGHIPTKMCYHLDETTTLRFLRCGWNAISDATIEHTAWNMAEDRLLRDIIYNDNDMIPIDVTNTRNISTRAKCPTFHSTYLKWQISAGQKKTLKELAECRNNLLLDAEVKANREIAKLDEERRKADEQAEKKRAAAEKRQKTINERKAATEKKNADKEVRFVVTILNHYYCTLLRFAINLILNYKDSSRSSCQGDGTIKS